MLQLSSLAITSSCKNETWLRKKELSVETIEAIIKPLQEGNPCKTAVKEMGFFQTVVRKILGKYVKNGVKKSRHGGSILSGEYLGPPSFIFQTREEKMISTFLLNWLLC